ADGVITRYCHMVIRPLVSAGDQVAAGQQIGWSGTSGRSSGPHLHFQVHVHGDGHASGAVDPVPWVRQPGGELGGNRWAAAFRTPASAPPSAAAPPSSVSACNTSTAATTRRSICLTPSAESGSWLTSTASATASATVSSLPASCTALDFPSVVTSPV